MRVPNTPSSPRQMRSPQAQEDLSYSITFLAPPTIYPPFLMRPPSLALLSLVQHFVVFPVGARLAQQVLQHPVAVALGVHVSNMPA